MNIRTQFFAVAISLATLPSNAFAQRVLMGAGRISCAEFSASYKQAPQLTEQIFMSWVLGFAAGASLSDTSRGEITRDLGGKSYQEQSKYIRDYCEQNPLKKVIEAAIALYGTLPVARH